MERGLRIPVLASIAMNASENTRHKIRKDCKYKSEELDQILPFKQIFINADTVPQRILILRSQILPAMFNYWAANGKEPKDEEESRSRAKVKGQSHN
jgi:hypothetical protein